jgi:hypothetical protein
MEEINLWVDELEERIAPSAFLWADPSNVANHTVPGHAGVMNVEVNSNAANADGNGAVFFPPC